MSDYPNHTGGGYYGLSDGTTMRGKQAAIRAQMRIAAKEEEVKPTPVAAPKPAPKPKAKAKAKAKLACPRCKSTVLYAIRSHEVRSVMDGSRLPRIYSCTKCGKRWPLK